MRPFKASALSALANAKIPLRSETTLNYYTQIHAKKLPFLTVRSLWR
jgi:hypothetical protein